MGERTRVKERKRRKEIFHVFVWLSLQKKFKTEKITWYNVKKNPTIVSLSLCAFLSRRVYWRYMSFLRRYKAVCMAIHIYFVWLNSTDNGNQFAQTSRRQTTHIYEKYSIYLEHVACVAWCCRLHTSGPTHQGCLSLLSLHYATYIFFFLVYWSTNNKRSALSSAR